MSQTPQAFLQHPAYGARHPQPVGPAMYTHEPRAPYVPRMAARVSVRADGWVHLNAEAALLLPPGDGTADLRTPIRHADNWHLDCRAGGLCKLLPVGATGGVRFRALTRVRALLGVSPGPLHFQLEHVGNGLFKLFAESANN